MRRNFNSTYIDLTMQESRGVEAKHTRSDDLRSALLGNHMPTAVSRAAAGMNSTFLSDGSFRVAKNLLCLCALQKMILWFATIAKTEIACKAQFLENWKLRLHLQYADCGDVGSGKRHEGCRYYMAI